MLNSIKKVFFKPLGKIEDKNPIFIVGAARSGTTLLSMILNSHSKIGFFGETQAYHVIRYKYATNFEKKKNLNRFLRDWNSHVKSNTPYPDLLKEEKVIEKLKTSKTYAETINVVMEAFINQEKKTIWGDKSPSHIFRLKTILEAFPKAKIIHIVRDPRSVITSQLEAFNRNNFSDKNIVLKALYWNAVVKKKKKYDRIDHNNYMLCTYESVIEDTLLSIKKICQFLNVEFEQGMLSYYEKSEKYGQKDKDGILTKHHHLITKKVDKSRISRWKNRLSAFQIALIEKICKKGMETFHYNFENSDENNYKINTVIIVGKLRWYLKVIWSLIISIVKIIYWIFRHLLKMG